MLKNNHVSEEIVVLEQCVSKHRKAVYIEFCVFLHEYWLTVKRVWKIIFLTNGSRSLSQTYEDRLKTSR